jgi:hypothetical protein
MTWEHRDAGNSSFRTTGVTSSVNGSGAGGLAPAEMDPMGADVGRADPYITYSAPPEDSRALMPYPSFGNPMDMQTAYSYNGSPISAAEAASLFNRQAGGAGFFLLFEDVRASLDSSNYQITKKWVPGGVPKNPGSEVIGTLETTSLLLVQSLSLLVNTFSSGFAQQSPQNPEHRLTPDEVAKIRENLVGLLTDKCKSFINKLISTVKGSPYDSGKQLLADYNSVDKQGGFFFRPLEVSGTAGGSIDNKNCINCANKRFV